MNTALTTGGRRLLGLDTQTGGSLLMLMARALSLTNNNALQHYREKSQMK